MTNITDTTPADLPDLQQVLAATGITLTRPEPITDGTWNIVTLDRIRDNWAASDDTDTLALKL